MKNYIYITFGILAFIIGLGINFPSVIVSMLPLALMGAIIIYPRVVMKKFAYSALGIRIFFLYLVSLFSVLAVSYSLGLADADMIRKIVIIILFVSFSFLMFLKYVIFKNEEYKRNLTKSLLMHTYVIASCIIPFILVNTVN